MCITGDFCEVWAEKSRSKPFSPYLNPPNMLSFISLHKENWRSHSYAAACCVGDQVLFQIRKGKYSIKAEYKMESVRLVQVKDRPFFSVVG